MKKQSINMKKSSEKTKTERPSWDEYFINIAIETAKRSSCIKRHVGAVIVKNKHILATGYNGAPSGISSCYEKDLCMRRERKIEHGKDKDLCLAVHAEANALCQAAKIGVPVENSVLYVTTYPCPTCAKLIINSGLKQVNYIFVYYGQQYSFSKEILTKAKIKTRKVTPSKSIDDKLIR